MITTPKYAWETEKKYIETSAAIIFRQYYYGSILFFLPLFFIFSKFSRVNDYILATLKMTSLCTHGRKKDYVQKLFSKPIFGVSKFKNECGKTLSSQTVDPNLFKPGYQTGNWSTGDPWRVEIRRQSHLCEEKEWP